MRSLVVVFMMLLSFGVQARDDGRYANSSNKAWFDSLRNGDNEGCCSDADGSALLDTQWRSHGDSYEVLIEGQWWPVPPKAVLKRPNLDGRTIVWPVPIRDGDKIIAIIVRCFIPGTGS